MNDNERDHVPTLAERIRAGREERLAGSPDPEPVPRHLIKRARAIKDQAIPGTQEHNMREERLAELEERRPRYTQQH